MPLSEDVCEGGPLQIPPDITPSKKWIIKQKK